MDPVVVVPARAGSLEIRDKNLRPLAGVSPLDRAVRCALAITAHVIVTTDYPVDRWPTPAGVTRHARSAMLATAEASMVDVVRDVLEAYPGPLDEIILLVQPTQPLRRPTHLRAALAMLKTHARVASVTLAESAQKCYFEGFRPVTTTSVERRQDAIPTYRCDGTVYGVQREAWLRDPRFLVPGYTQMLVIDPDETCALDTPLDWMIAEWRVRARESLESAL